MRAGKTVSFVRGIILLGLTCTVFTGCKAVNAVDGHNRRVKRHDEAIQSQLDADEQSYKQCVLYKISNQYQLKQGLNEIADLAISSCDAGQFHSDYESAIYRHARLAREPLPTDVIEQASNATKEMIAHTKLTAVQAVGNYRAEYAAKIGKMRASNDPWDKYLLFSDLSAGIIEPLDPDEISRTAREAFAGFGECAKETDPSCMDMYGELILRGANSLDEKEKVEARRKAFYWLTLAARYGYVRARKVLVSEEEDIPSPDLAMEKLQKEANNIAINSQISAERIAREKAARDYELIRETRRQTEQLIWANLFPKMVNCTSNKIGSYTYTNCW